MLFSTQKILRLLLRLTKCNRKQRNEMFMFVGVPIKRTKSAMELHSKWREKKVDIHWNGMPENYSIRTKTKAMSVQFKFDVMAGIATVAYTQKSYLVFDLKYFPFFCFFSQGLLVTFKSFVTCSYFGCEYVYTQKKHT